ncbi:MAG: hypothetical protein AAB153_05810, partial [Pseudomonadota bacterium]
MASRAPRRSELSQRMPTNQSTNTGSTSHAGEKTAALHVRPAAISDVPTILHLLEIYSAQGNLLPRT